MKQITIKTYFLYLFAALTFIQIGCEKESTNKNPPQITRIRASTPAPNDSTLTAALPGQFVVIQGTNLAAASQIFFNGFPATFNSGIFSETSLVVKVPNIAWDSIPAGKTNTVEVTTPAGTATYKFTITAPVPSVTAISNENALAGTVITITGTDFYGISKVVFPGNIAVTSITANSSKSISVTVPTGITMGGPLQITGMYGTGTSNIIFDNYLSPTVGFLANFEDGSPYMGWQYWGGNKTGDAALFPKNTGNYVQVHPPGSVPAGNGAWYADNRAVMVSASPWMPTANLSDPLDNYALKFEIFVKDPWKTGSLVIAPNGNFGYTARYAPWESNGTGTFTTNGAWQTVVIPLSRFLNSTGGPAQNITTLSGATGSATMQIMLYNDGTTTLTSFDAAVDNVRIVKVK